MSKKKIYYPAYACQTPIIKGVSSTIYDNLLSYSKKVIALSATMSEQQTNYIEQKANVYNFPTQHIRIEQMPFKFNVTMLKLEEKLSRERIENLLESISHHETKVFWVEPTQKAAVSSYESIKSHPLLGDKLLYFERQDYNSCLEKSSHRENSGDILLTYGKSAICKAHDLADVNLVIVDCSMFIPNIALNFDGTTDLLEQRQQQADSINTNLTQIIGRVFRSREQRIEGQTVVDPRQIVVVLHNLPPELYWFCPQKNLIETYNEYSSEQVLGRTTKRATENLIRSVQEALESGVISDKDSIEREAIKQKAVRQGMSSLKKRTEKELLTDEDVAEIKMSRRQTRRNS